MPKTSIRDDLLVRRRQLSLEGCLLKSRSIQERLQQTPEFQGAVRLALYSPILNEVFTEELFHAARRQSKTVAYPRVRGASLEFVEVADLRELSPGAFGVLEPRGARLVPVESLDLLVIPGVAFDRSGFRLGYGKGFYDRALHRCLKSGRLIGLAFDFQLVTALPAEVHDVGMDMIVTEARLLRFAGQDSPNINPKEQGGSRP